MTWSAVVSLGAASTRLVQPSAVSPLVRGTDESGGVTPLVPSSQRRREAEVMALMDGTGTRLPIPGRAVPESAGGIAPERLSSLHPPMAATARSMAPAAYWARRRRPDGRDFMTVIMPPSV